MKNIEKTKSRLNAALLFSLIVVVSISIFAVKYLVSKHSIENATIQARQMSNQMLIMRKYLSIIAPKAKILDHNLSQFSIAPAFVGEKISEGMLKEYNFYIKQTSLKYRNPKNKPDKYEVKVLQEYENGKIHGEYSEITLHNGIKALRYSKPLYIKKACMKCHGKPNIDVSKDLYKRLVATYGNKSFNYKIGELRGIISVSIPMVYVKSQNEVLLNSLIVFNILLFIFWGIYIYIEKKYIFQPQLKESEDLEEYEKTVIESSTNAIIAIDWTAKIKTYNKKAEEIFGWTKEEMIGTRNLIRIIPPKYKELHTNAHRKYLDTGVSCGVIDKTHELEGITKDGRIFPLQISFGSSWKPKGAIVVASIIDITKEKEQSNMLIQQSKMASMGEMIANIAHQWRQPLSAISTSASGTLLEKELGILKDNTLEDRLNGIVNNTQFLSQTIEDFRNFFKQTDIKEEFSVNGIINNVEHIVDGTLKSKNIKLIKNYDNENIILCKGISSELSQVIINIVNNAKDILLEKEIVDKFIKIDLTKKEDNVTIKIYDNAGGVPENIINKIFDPYFTTKHQSQGTGIGLYMSSEIISSHFKGHLSVSNETFKLEDKEYFGACFKIDIPS